MGELADEQLQPVTNEVIRAMQSLEQQGEEPTFERLMLHFDAPEKKNLLVAIDQRAAEKPASAMQEAVDDLRQALQKRKLKKDLAHQQANLQDENLDHDTQREMLKSFFATRQRLNE